MSSPAPHPPAPAPAEPKILDSLADIPAADWDALTDGNPTLCHAWLSSLHETGCASAESGWIPQYLTLWRESKLVAAMPLYVKLHSYGEYVFDWAWADAYERSGLHYFPKLLSAVPFTPCTGSRLMATNDADRLQLLELAVNAARSSEVSSLHILFPPDAEIDLMQAEGLMRRTTIQFHWRNAGFKSFDDYLAAMSHDKRKRIKQERRKVGEAGVTFQHLVGANIREEDWDFFHACYVKTYREHRSTPYLNRDFFTAIAERMPDNLLMVVGWRDGQRICAALNLFNAHTLYGRYWGATDFVSGLHFGTCYYQAIAFCIERNIQLFEGGAQGAHKLARGFLPVKTWSAHWLKQPQFAKAVEDYLRRETGGIEERLDELEGSSPFKRQSFVV
ncbi:MAG: GNAT family N-acetyltransferase [Burkholderiales bacterium]|nr:GNAT family N-acetyltransferase [Burkholderiales bacterium]